MTFETSTTEYSILNIQQQLINSSQLLDSQQSLTTDEWNRYIFGIVIFLTAIITFLLNLFVIITLLLNRYKNNKLSNNTKMLRTRVINRNQTPISTPTTTPTTSPSTSTTTSPLTSPSVSTTTTPISSTRSSFIIPNKIHNNNDVDDENILTMIMMNNNRKKLSTTDSEKSILKATIMVKNRRKKFSHTQQSFISLSISVIMYSSICVPIMYLETIEPTPTPTPQQFISLKCLNNYCFIIIQLFRFFFYVSPIASSFIHLLMAFDRYLAIKQCYLLQSYWYRRHYTFCIFFVWFLSILIIIPFFWYNYYGRTTQIILTIIRLLFTFSIPSLLTLYLYINIAYELKRLKMEKNFYFNNNQSSKINNTNTNNANTNNTNNNLLIKKHQNIILKIILLALIHFLCWFPFSVIESLNDLYLSSPTSPTLMSSNLNIYLKKFNLSIQKYYYFMSILILFTSMSGIAYPILYCFVSNEFRKIFGSFFSSSFKQNNNNN